MLREQKMLEITILLKLSTNKLIKKKGRQHLVLLGPLFDMPSQYSTVNIHKTTFLK